MLIKNCQIIGWNGIEEGDVRISDGKIAEIGSNLGQERAFIDAKGLYLAPGFIDIHIHGAAGTDVMDGTYESLHNIAKTIAAHGTTSFLATTMTCAVKEIRQALKAIRDAKGRGTEGANILGAHLEGPFIHKDMIGAQNPQYVLPPTIERFLEITEGQLDIVREITLAPEVEGAQELIGYLVSQGIVVSIGHTAAFYEDVRKAVKWGVSHSTHLFNAMKGIHHREAGTVGGIFDTDITTEIICDGIHVSDPIIRLVLQQKSIDKVILVSDAMMACCMKSGEYELGGQKVVVNEEGARLENGVLAGSVLTLDQAVKHVYHKTDYSLHEVIKMVTYNPARHCGVLDHKGIIKEGYDADLVLFDKNIQIKKVWIGGAEYL